MQQEYLEGVNGVLSRLFLNLNSVGSAQEGEFSVQAMPSPCGQNVDIQLAIKPVPPQAPGFEPEIIAIDGDGALIASGALDLSGHVTLQGLRSWETVDFHAQNRT